MGHTAAPIAQLNVRCTTFNVLLGLVEDAVQLGFAVPLISA